VIGLQETQVTYVCDKKMATGKICGMDAPHERTLRVDKRKPQTVRLCDAHNRMFDRETGTYQERPTIYVRGVTPASAPAKRMRPRRRRGAQAADRPPTVELAHVAPSVIRAWAIGKGLMTSKTGRVPEDIQKKYHAAHRSGRRAS
jgi:hypothetical protein